MRRVEKDGEAGWIARKRDGSIYYDDDWRWNTRAGARDVVRELDWIEDRDCELRAAHQGAGEP